MTGKEAEERFYAIMSASTQDIRRATEEENIKGQFDIVCEGVRYDVKGEKRYNRKDKHPDTNTVWIEVRNVNGDRGWIKGDADKIAFLKGNVFHIVDRKKLFILVQDKVRDLRIYNIKQYCKLYRRTGRKDVVTYLSFGDIEHLIEKTIKINETI